MDKYIIRGSIAAAGLSINVVAIPYNWPNGLLITLGSVGAGFCLLEVIICLICYHHALWTNQDQTEQESQDGTK